MNKSYLLIGGNQGDRVARLAEARAHIERMAGAVLRYSSLYETAAWGRTDQADFINQALLADTPLGAPAFMAALLLIEEMMGRKRVGKWGPRIIDIDILFFNDEIVDLPGLSIPHPELQNRRFALAPMEEIAPDYIHPVLHKTIRDLLAECPDKGDVKKLVTII